jgi:two-component sensor histidine kinase
MSFEIGPLPPIQPGVPTRRPAPATAADFSAQLKRASAPAGDVAVISLPPSPPPEVLDAVAEARDRAAELAASNRELHFRTDEDTGRVVVQVRDLAGNVIRTIPPSEALAVMSGAPL